MSDPQQVQWEAFEQQQLAVGRCPGSGGALLRRSSFDGPRNPAGTVMACAMCDCFGYKPEEVGNGGR